VLRGSTSKCRSCSGNTDDLLPTCPLTTCDWMERTLLLFRLVVVAVVVVVVVVSFSILRTASSSSSSAAAATAASFCFEEECDSREVLDCLFGDEDDDGEAADFFIFLFH